MKFSIITITYNSADTLPATIESVLSQSFKTIEYVLVDGASTDNTVEIIQQFSEKDSRISYISEPDEGIANAFNKGIYLASGDWVGILNSDDQYTEGALAKVVEVIQENPEAGVIHGDMIRLAQDGRPLFVIKPADIATSIWHQMPLNHPTVFVKKQVYEKVGEFNSDFKIAMDYDMIFRMFKAGVRFVYVKEVLAHMRYGGASDSRVLEGLKEWFRISRREGYPLSKAVPWMCYWVVLRCTKNMLRYLGVDCALKLHPRLKGWS